MDAYSTVKTLHILSSTILFGTGIGIAFFMWRSWFVNDLTEKRFAANTTVLADAIFTLPAVIIQPLTGAWLVMQSGYNWQDTWLMITLIIYAMAGLCWLPVVWIQIKIRRIVNTSLLMNSELPEEYHRLFKLWTLLGVPAFIGLVTVFFLMVTKPT